MPSMLFEMRDSGFARKSTAPSSSARKTLRLSEHDESTSTGVGRSFMSHRRNVKPSIFGISRSRVITSGARRSVLATASTPSTALPTTSIPSSLASIWVMTVRLKAESSTTSVFIFPMAIVRPLRAAALAAVHPHRLLVDHVVLERAEREGVRNIDQRLRVSEQQVPALPKLVVEALDHFFLRLLVEINNHVPVEDDIHVADQ